MHGHLDGAALYAALADAEPDPARKELFTRVAQAEKSDAERWLQRLERAGERPGPFHPSFRTRLLSRLARHFGAHFVLPTVVAGDIAQAEPRTAEPPVTEPLAAAEEKATLLAALVQTETGGRRTSGNDLRAAVLGANDGLASNFCLMMGVAGAGSAGKTVLLAGLAGLVAGACSMALGEWLSVSNARELAQKQLAQTRAEFERSPQAQERRLALIFQAKGLPGEDAQRVALQIMQSRPAAVETLAREELGIDPEALGGNAWSAAALSFALFALGALVPVVPFTILHGTPGIALCVAASGAALAGIGSLTALFNGRSTWYSALRQVLFGTAAAGVTFGVGALLRVSVT